MAPQEADSPAIRLVNVLAFLPIVAILLTGFYSHKHYGTDGIVGILLGLYGVGYLVVAVQRWDTENLSPLRRFILKYRTALVIVFVLCIVGGVLDCFGLL